MQRPGSSEQGTRVILRNVRSSTDVLLPWANPGRDPLWVQSLLTGTLGLRCCALCKRRHVDLAVGYFVEGAGEPTPADLSAVCERSCSIAVGSK